MTEKIIAALKNIPANIDSNKGNGYWTKSVMQAIKDLGQEEGYEICASGIDGCEKGWLYDLIWYKENSDGVLCEVPLVMESEWDKKYVGIKFDFEKLLLARSQYKIMVFQAAKEKVDERIEKLRQGISAFKSHSIPEIYILACFEENSYKFEIEIIENG